MRVVVVLAVVNCVNLVFFLSYKFATVYTGYIAASWKIQPICLKQEGNLEEAENYVPIR